MDLAGLRIILAGALAAGLVGTAVARAMPNLKLSSVLANRLALVLVLAFVAVVGGMAIARHLAFNTTSYDLGIFDQVVWNSAQGRLFENSVMADSPSFLGHHFSPLLLILVPVYWVYPDATGLLAVQALLLGFAGLPLYWLARDTLRSPFLALCVLAAYLLYPATAYVALFDFHEIVLAVPLLSLSLYSLQRKRYRPFLIFLLPALLVKEDVGILVAGVGIHVLLYHRGPLGLALAAGGLLWTLSLIRFVIPAFHPSGEYYFASQYSSLGSSPEAILATIARDPFVVLSKIGRPESALYLQQLLAPLAALPLFGFPSLVMAAPSLAYILLNESIPSDLIRYQYSAPLLGPLFVSAVEGLRWIRRRLSLSWPLLSPGLGASTLGAAACAAFLYGPLPFASHFDPGRYIPSPRLASARAIIAQIPSDASVIAQTSLVPQVSHRRMVQVFGYADPTLRPDYYLLDTDPKANRWPFPSGWDEPYLQALARIEADGEYHVAAMQDDFLLLRRGVPELTRSGQSSFGEDVAIVGYFIKDSSVSAGNSLPLNLYWRAQRKLATNYSLFVHLVDGGGKVVAQRDGYPVGDYPPTSQWEPGRLMRSDWDISVPREAPPGEYHLVAGLYNLANMQRLPLVGSSPPADSLSLEVNIQVLPAR